jgi:2-keto-4-pentenoate hydratase/2-oxohepta-3-ene-1,7-dioic acid hydratase in catechol pathway
LHAALIVGEPLSVTSQNTSQLADQLAKFKLGLHRNGELVEEGAGRNSLRSPALCLGELARVTTFAPGLVSSGTLTTPTLIAPSEEWKATVEGLDLQPLVLQVNS